MLKEIIFLLFTLLALSLALPAEETVDSDQNKAYVVDPYYNQDPLSGQEGLEGAESANPQWGWRRGWGGYGGRWGGYGGGWGRGWGGYGGWGGWGRRGWGWGK